MKIICSCTHITCAGTSPVHHHKAVSAQALYCVVLATVIRSGMPQEYISRMTQLAAERMTWLNRAPK